MPTDRPKLDLTAPVGSVDLAAFEEDGTPFTIWPCHDCLPWHAEVITDSGTVLVREWHAIDCPTFRTLTAGAPREQ